VDVHVALQGARSALDLAWSDGGRDALCIAVIQAAEAVETATSNCLQVCGGMGFTEEFPLASRIRRAIALGAVLPDPEATADLLGRSLSRGAALARLGGFDVLG
jgi:alkylation response protein AidB-like acyl-CoA dehydrogenase